MIRSGQRWITTRGPHRGAVVVVLGVQKRSVLFRAAGKGHTKKHHNTEGIDAFLTNHRPDSLPKR